MCTRAFPGWSGVLAVALVAFAASVGQADQRPVTIEERASGAERVLVASVQDVTATYETNEFGDRLIVSHARLVVEEALKGPADPITLDYEGGTVDGLTLRVSTLPVMQRGDRAVFFVRRGRRGEFIPHLRGQGILKLDARDHVPNSSLTLTDLRRMAGGQPR
jgi:hypothetical protein